MARKLTLQGKAPQSGHNVSHSHRCTNRQWLPNMQRKALFSHALGRSVRLTITTSGMRTVDRAGGLDNYLLNVAPEELNPTMRRLQAMIRERTQTV